MTIKWSRLALVALLMFTVRSLPANAESSLPAPMHQRIIVHGVHTTGDAALVDGETAALLDEAVQTAKDAGNVTILLQEDTSAMGAGADDAAHMRCDIRAVRAYLTTHGIVLTRVTVDAVDAPGLSVATDTTCDHGGQVRLGKPQAN